MTKADLIKELSRRTGLTKDVTAEVLQSLEKITREILQAGHKMAIPGVVTITISDRAARMGRNPATGETVQIPAKRVVKAKVVADLQNAI